MVNGDPALVQAATARLGMRAIANEARLAGRFLADDAFTPQGYLDAAKRQQDLQRVLLALT